MVATQLKREEVRISSLDINNNNNNSFQTDDMILNTC